MDTKLNAELYDFLVDFGLSEREITLYLALLRTGPNTIMNLARETAIKRSTTHNNVEELIKKGLVSQTNYGERRMVIAEDPEKLKFLMEQKKWKVKKMEENLPSVIKNITQMVPEVKDKNDVEVKYYRGTKEVGYVYDLSLKANEVYSFINIDKYYEIFPDTRHLFADAFKNNPKREVWDIAADTKLAREIAKSAQSKYHCKVIPGNVSFSGVDLLIFENKLAIIQLDIKDTMATVIRSEIISSSLIALHKTMWELLS